MLTSGHFALLYLCISQLILFTIHLCVMWSVACVNGMKCFLFVGFRKKKKKVADKILPQRVGVKLSVVGNFAVDSLDWKRC